MKIINRDQLINDVKVACIKANRELPCDVAKRIDEMRNTETNERAKTILHQFKENLQIAQEKQLPMCQDTGIVVGLIKLGNQVQYDFDLYEAINEGIRQGYADGNLRKSVVSNPVTRNNSGDNTPGVFHVELTGGEDFELTIAPKGAGSENMSALKMFTPQTPMAEIEQYVVDVVVNAKGKPCPPIIVGVGLGGTFEKAALMAKEAVLQPLESTSDQAVVAMATKIKDMINKTGIGPMGLGGDSTCIGVNINTYAAHIASLAVAVNIQCHVSRHEVIKY